MNKSHDGVSIVIPVYNSSRYIEDTIRSVKSSCLDICYEVIIVDDVSDDFEDLSAILSEYEFVTLIVKEGKSNASVSRNIGIQNARFDYVFLLDADDLYSPEYIKHRVELMRSNKHSLYFGAYNSLDPNGVKKPHVSFYDGSDMRDYLFLKNGDIRTSTISINKKFHKGTMFDEKQGKHQDWGFGIKCFNNNESIYYDPTPLINICSGRHFQMSGKMNIDASKYFLNEYLQDEKYYASFINMHYIKAIIQADRTALMYFNSVLDTCDLSLLFKIKYYILKLSTVDVFFGCTVFVLRKIKKLRSGYI
ncbi:TPA: glycosyltransferase family 2 protein [Raoultella ornithinolytica]|uniref:glycosyltransferase family 2 protein n=1 Tax=Raoultella ornithinolytica TaxID=54291 RepID=UPI0010D34198|nr:glycosyltransferase family 2 protein [Raoultella ornithinolytica]WPO25343.1 glycosyltransferase family 2 protein [Raoultella ornithinolytica]VTM88920.1 Chondroitin polymerase [Raoultella ornithinolytica]HBQ8757374.1 glycosyltransferase family 2 protein [Klebsiella quasipneumoniae]